MEKNLKGYQGIFFDEETQKKLVELQKNGLNDIVNDMHITFNFGELGQYPDELMNKGIALKLIGYASDGKNSGFQVELPEELKSYYKNQNPPHITVSLGEVDGVKGKAVDTGTMNFEKLEEPVEISGSLGYFVFREDRSKSGKVMDNSVFKENQTQHTDEEAEYKKLKSNINELESLRVAAYEIIEDFQEKIEEERKRGIQYRIISEEDKEMSSLIKDMMRIRVQTREERLLSAIFRLPNRPFNSYNSPKDIYELIEKYEIEGKKNNDSELQQRFGTFVGESINKYKKQYNKYNNIKNKIANGINNMPMKDKKAILIDQLNGDISGINLDNEELKKYLMSEELFSDAVMKGKRENFDNNLRWIWDYVYIDDYDTAIKIAENVSEKGFTVEYGRKSLSEDLLNNPEFLLNLEQIGEIKANWDERIINRFKTVQIANIGKELSENKEFLMDMLSPFNLQVCNWASEKVANNREFGQKAINCYSEAFKLGDSMAFAEFNQNKRKYNVINSEDLEYLGLDEEGGYAEEEIEEKKKDRAKELEGLKKKYQLQSKDAQLSAKMEESEKLDKQIGQAEKLLEGYKQQDPEKESNISKGEE